MAWSRRKKGKWLVIVLVAGVLGGTCIWFLTYFWRVTGTNLAMANTVTWASGLIRRDHLVLNNEKDVRDLVRRAGLEMTHNDPLVDGWGHEIQLSVERVTDDNSDWFAVKLISPCGDGKVGTDDDMELEWRFPAGGDARGEE